MHTPILPFAVISKYTHGVDRRVGQPVPAEPLHVQLAHATASPRRHGRRHGGDRGGPGGVRSGGGLVEGSPAAALAREGLLRNDGQGRQDFSGGRPVGKLAVQAGVRQLAVRAGGVWGHGWEHLVPRIVVLSRPLALVEDLGAHKWGPARVQLPTGYRAGGSGPGLRGTGQGGQGQVYGVWGTGQGGQGQAQAVRSCGYRLAH